MVIILFRGHRNRCWLDSRCGGGITRRRRVRLAVQHKTNRPILLIVGSVSVQLYRPTHDEEGSDEVCPLDRSFAMSWSKMQILAAIRRWAELALVVLPSPQPFDSFDFSLVVHFATVLQPFRRGACISLCILSPLCCTLSHTNDWYDNCIAAAPIIIVVVTADLVKDSKACRPRNYLVVAATSSIVAAWTTE